MIDGREEEKGDIPVHLAFADEGPDLAALAEELRKRSQTETETIFWAVPATDAIDRESVELFRSREMLSKKTREARTAAEQHLIAEEQARSRRHQSELQRLLRAACLQGSAYFRGNDRSPDERVGDVGKASTTILGQVLPDVFTRFSDAAAKGPDVKRGFEALLTATDLQGLPPVFTALGLLRDEGGKTVFNLDAAPLREVMAEIEDAAVYGSKATGKALVERFARAPYGWDFEVVRLLVASLLRAGAIQMTHKAETVDSMSLAARDGLGNNNHFKQASFQPKKGVGFPEIAAAATNFKETFGVEAKELALSPLVAELRTQLAAKQDTIEHARSILLSAGLPGLSVLDDALSETRAILRGTEEAAISAFNAAHQTIKEGIRRAAELEGELGLTRFAGQLGCVDHAA